MIIEGLLAIILTLAKALFSFINLPNFPSGFMSVVNTGLGYIRTGISFVLSFFDIPTLRICIDIYIALIAFKYAYKFIMFVIGVIGRIKSGAEL